MLSRAAPTELTHCFYRVICCCLIVVSAFLLLAAKAQARDVPGSFADLVEELSPAVVNISTTQKQTENGNLTFRFQAPGIPEMEPFEEFFERFSRRFPDEMPQREVNSLGSGFVVDPDGYIVTNYHVIDGADEVTVTFQDDSQYQADIVGRDSKTDLALLKIEPTERLPYVEFGDSDTMRVGDWVIAIGNPFGLGGSVSAGIISARSRNINAGPFDDFIQTDAAINRGNSGGPLFNVEGEVIGVNSAIFSPSGGNVGIGFAIPSALAEPVLRQLREYGRTYRGWLGVKIQHVTDELADGLGLDKAKGALVLEVTPDSPAQESGMKPGDVILRYNDRNVEEMRDLPRMVAETKAGTKVDLRIWRNEEVKKLEVTIGELEEEAERKVSEVKPQADAPDADVLEWMGAKVVVLSDAMRRRYNLDETTDGVMITEITPGSPAFKARLQPGDVITQANQEMVKNLEALEGAIENAREEDKSHALLRIIRRGEPSFVTIPLAE